MAESHPKVVDRSGLLVGLAIVLVFSPLVGAGYVWDDSILIMQNTALSGWDGLMAAVSGGLWDHTPSAKQPPLYYRPLMLWSLIVDRWLGGGPGLAHAHSLFWHLLNVWLVRVIAARMGCGAAAAWTAAAVFGLHPVAVEAVAWVSARNDPMAVCGVLGAAAVALRAERPADLVAVGALAALGAGAKETAYLAPAYLVPIVWSVGRSVKGPALAALLGVVGVVGCRLAAGVAWPARADGAHLLASGWPAAMWAVDAVAVPSLRVPGAHLAWPEPIPVVGALLGALATAVVAWAGGRRSVGLLFVAVLGALPAWPAVAHVGLFGDRYLLLSLAAAALAVAVAIDPVARRHRLRPEVWLVVALPYAVAAAASIPAWSTDSALWSLAVERHRNPHTAGSLAKVLEVDGRLDEAASWYQVAVEPPRPLEHACWNVAALEIKRGFPASAGAVGMRALASGCPADRELACPTAYGLAWSGEWDGSEAVLTRLKGPGTGLCSIARLAVQARNRDADALEQAVGGDSARWTVLADRLGRLLRAGGDLDTAAWVDARAREGQGLSGG